jgi:hypothetical protein
MLLAVVLVIVPQAVDAEIAGTANGDLAMITNGESAFAYSTYTLTWSSVELDGPCLAVETSPSLGLVLTLGKLTAYSAISGGWFTAKCSGVPAGYDVRGAVIVCWTEEAAYGISTVWAQWARKVLKVEESPLGGGSAGNFGFLWTDQNVYAYSGATGRWSSEKLGGPPIGGIACDGLGLVWTDIEAYTFDPTPGNWIRLDLMGYPFGMSADGAGKAAVIWSASSALAYSGHLEDWFPAPSVITGACAAGDLALTWNEEMAYSFDANLGTWSGVPIRTREPAAAPGEGPVSASFAISPNPCGAGPLALQLPAGGEWNIEVIDIEGRAVHRDQVPAASEKRAIEWDWRDDQGRSLPAGTYWVRAISAERTEARRVIRLP